MDEAEVHCQWKLCSHQLLRIVLMNTVLYSIKKKYEIEVDLLLYKWLSIADVLDNTY